VTACLQTAAGARTTCRASYGRSTMAQPRYLTDGRLTFTAPPGAYATIPAWHSAAAWLGAAKLHPHLATVCRQHHIAVPVFLAVLRILAEHADHDTGRDIAVAHATVGARLDRCEKTIQRACRAAEDLGLLAHVLEGTDMTLQQRIAVLGHYTRGTPSAQWRSLPNFYAATMPPPITALTPPKPAPKPVRGTTFAAVDNPPPPAVHNRANTHGHVHLPEGSAVPPKSSISSYFRTTTFHTDCAQPAPPAPSKTPTTAAARPTTTHQRTTSAPPARLLDPAVAQFARDLRASLPGYQALSLHRICPALSSYLKADLSPADLRHGLNDYLTATGHTWLTTWSADQQDQQARYLIGMLTKARQAGYIIPGP
jgi:hypothetical protein